MAFRVLFRNSKKGSFGQGPEPWVRAQSRGSGECGSGCMGVCGWPLVCVSHRGH